MSRQATAHRTQQGPGATLGAAGIVDRTVIVPGIGIAAMIAVATPLLVTVIMTVAIPVGSAIVIAVTIVVIPTAIISIPVPGKRQEVASFVLSSVRLKHGGDVRWTKSMRGLRNPSIRKKMEL